MGRVTRREFADVMFSSDRLGYIDFLIKTELDLTAAEAVRFEPLGNCMLGAFYPIGEPRSESRLAQMWSASRPCSASLGGLELLDKQALRRRSRGSRGCKGVVSRHIDLMTTSQSGERISLKSSHPTKVCEKVKAIAHKHVSAHMLN